MDKLKQNLCAENLVQRNYFNISDSVYFSGAL